VRGNGPREGAVMGYAIIEATPVLSFDLVPAQEDNADEEADR
jgi:hypothetical protein